MKRVRFLREDIQDFLLSFEDSTVSKIIASLEFLDEMGRKIGPPESKKLTNNIYELRVISSLTVRILYTFHQDDIWILHAFIKKTQKIPPKELKLAINRLKYLQ